MQSGTSGKKSSQKSTKQPKGRYIRIEISRFDELQLELDSLKDKLFQLKDDVKVDMRQEIVDICYEMMTEFMEKYKQEVNSMLDNAKVSLPFFGKRLLIVVRDKGNDNKP